MGIAHPREIKWPSYLGKGALTVISPPLGLAIFNKGKGIRQKLAGGALGMFLSFAVSIGIIANSKENIAPGVNNYRNQPMLSGKNMAEIFLSPLAVAFDPTQRENTTKIKDAFASNHGLYVPAPIDFNKKTGKYEVYMNERTSIGWYSISQIEERVQSYKVQLHNQVSAGDLTEGQKTKIKVIEEEERLALKREEYDSIRKQFQTEVDTLNSQLEKLAQAAQ